jgi:alanine racemase
MQSDEHGGPNRFEIDLGAIAGFACNIRKVVGAEATIFAALKCNAYGFGLGRSRAPSSPPGSTRSSVVDRADAIAVREGGIGGPILVYPGGLATPAAVAAGETYNLIPTIVDRVVSVYEMRTVPLSSRFLGAPSRLFGLVAGGQTLLDNPTAGSRSPKSHGSVG